MTEEKWVAKFEEWFRRQDPEPVSTSTSRFAEVTLREERLRDDWNIRYFSAKLGYLQGCRDEAKESKLGGCYNLLCHTEKVQGEKKIMELEGKIERLKAELLKIKEIFRKNSWGFLD